MGLAKLNWGGAGEEERVTMEEHALLECLELAMPWLTPAELATLSSTCKTLNHISKSITSARASDASRSFENLPVPFVNACDAHPYAYFHYTPSQILPSQSSLLRRQPWGSNNQNSTLPPPGLMLPYTGEESGCGCESCGCECLCGGFVEGSEVMSECGPGCGCGLNCENRVTQRGVSVGLKIVRDEKKGWGLHAAQFIPKGQFVCEYAGTIFLHTFHYLIVYAMFLREVWEKMRKENRGEESVGN